MDPQEHIIIIPDSSAELNLIQFAELTEFKPEVIVQASQPTNCFQHIETNLTEFIREKDDNPEECIKLMITENHEDEEIVVEHVVDEGDLKCSSLAEGGGSRVTFEIPTSSMYSYENPLYLNHLMKDNTCGRRVGPDAPYTQRLGMDG